MTEQAATKKIPKVPEWGKYIKYRDDCRDLFINKRWPRKDILEKYPELSKLALYDWIINESWVAQRDGIIRSATADIAIRRQHTLTTLLGDSLEAISKTVKAYAKNGMTMEEAKDLSTVVANMDKLIRLADNRPTDITENRNLNVNLPAKAMATKADIEDAIRIVQDDPFTANE